MRFERESHSIAKVDLELSYVAITDWLLTPTHRSHDSALEHLESWICIYHHAQHIIKNYWLLASNGLSSWNF